MVNSMLEGTCICIWFKETYTSFVIDSSLMILAHLCQILSTSSPPRIIITMLLSLRHLMDILSSETMDCCCSSISFQESAGHHTILSKHSFASRPDRWMLTGDAHWFACLDFTPLPVNSSLLLSNRLRLASAWIRKNCKIRTGRDEDRPAFDRIACRDTVHDDLSLVLCWSASGDNVERIMPR